LPTDPAVLVADHSDQAAIFIYLDKHVWVKAGVEFDNDKLWDGAVVTNPFSDWYVSICPPPDL
jgi:regulation of enolase protein 1 (concanavalin A-like superfamily)